MWEIKEKGFYSPIQRSILWSFLQFAKIRGNRMGVVWVATLETAEKHLVLMDQLFTEDEMGHRAGERAHCEQDHAPSDPLRPVTLAPVVRKQERGTDLADLRRWHYNTGGLWLNLEQLLDRRDHRDEVRVVHSLEDL